MDELGYAVLDAASPQHAIREALTGTVQLFVPPPSGGAGYSEYAFPYTAGTVGFTAAEHKAYLIQPAQPGGGLPDPEAPPPPPPIPGATHWSVCLEDLSFVPPDCDWDYNDRFWTVEVLDLTTPPEGVEMVAGRMWTDLDKDGIQAGNEPGEPWLGVQLLKHGVAVGNPVLTDEDGYFSFPVFRDPEADYTLQFEKPTGCTFTTPFAGDDRTIDSDADPLTGVTPELFTTSSPFGAVAAGLLLAQEAAKWTVRAPETTEGNGVGQTHQMTFTVTRRMNTAQAAAVDYTTIAGTATAGQDYDAVAGTLNFAPNQVTATVTVNIKEDGTKENDEEFFLVLKDPTFVVMPNGNTVEGRRTPFGRGIIRNDDYPQNYVNSWTEWVVDPRPSSDAITNYQNGTWMRGWDGDTPTYLTPTGTPWVHSMIDEGHYLKHNSAQPYGAFEFVVDWRVADAGQAATPMAYTGKYRMDQNAEHFGNSGVYIYNMYEVQVISSAVQFGQPVPDQGTTPKTKLTPGWPYEVPVPAGQGIYNYSVAPGSWNRMRVKFTPPTIVGGQITQAAKLKVSFEFANGLYVAFGGSDGWELLGLNGKKLKGTGSRQSGDLDPVNIGRIFLQSHWGSLVEYKNPFFV